MDRVAISAALVCDCHGNVVDRERDVRAATPIKSRIGIKPVVIFTLSWSSSERSSTRAVSTAAACILVARLWWHVLSTTLCSHCPPESPSSWPRHNSFF